MELFLGLLRLLLNHSEMVVVEDAQGLDHVGIPKSEREEWRFPTKFKVTNLNQSAQQPTSAGGGNRLYIDTPKRADVPTEVMRNMNDY